MADPFERIVRDFRPSDLEGTLELARGMVRRGEWTTVFESVVAEGLYRAHGREAVDDLHQVIWEGERDGDLDRRLAAHAPEDLDASLELVRDLVRAGRWDTAEGRALARAIAGRHGEAGRRQLGAAVADAELGRRLMSYDGRELEAGLQLVRDLVKAGRWDADTAHVVYRCLALYHNTEFEELLERAIAEALGER